MINIEGQNLKKFLEVKFNKKIVDITPADLENLNSVSFIGDINVPDFGLNFADLSHFPNLQELIITNKNLGVSELKKISSFKNIMTIKFIQCIFDDEISISLLNDIINLEFVNCEINNYDFLTNFSKLNSLVVIKPVDDTIINLNLISNNKELSALILDTCQIVNFQSLEKNINLVYLSILWTILPNNYDDVINKLPKLKELFISDIYDTSRINDYVQINNDLRKYTFD